MWVSSLQASAIAIATLVTCWFTPIDQVVSNSPVVFWKASNETGTTTIEVVSIPEPLPEVIEESESMIDEKIAIMVFLGSLFLSLVFFFAWRYWCSKRKPKNKVTKDSADDIAKLDERFRALKQSIEEKKDLVSNNKDAPKITRGNKTITVGSFVTYRDAEGVVQYIGTTNGSYGYWIGIVLTTPIGNSDGTIRGSRYFSCPPNYGVFVRANHPNLSF